MSLCLMTSLVTFANIHVMSGKRVALVIDVQHDFVDPAGSLSVFKKDNPIPAEHKPDAYVGSLSNKLRSTNYDAVVYSIDFHPRRHCSFATSYTPNAPVFKVNNNSRCEPKEQMMWPAHCVQRSAGADLHPKLAILTTPTQKNIIVENGANYPASECAAAGGGKKNAFCDYYNKQIERKPSMMHDGRVLHPTVFWLFKGLQKTVDSYSAFLGNGQNREKSPPTGLDTALTAHGFAHESTAVDVFGVAYDYCVKFTALDAKQLGFKDVNFLTKLTAPVQAAVGGDPQTKKNVDMVNEELTTAGVKLVESS